MFCSELLDFFSLLACLTFIACFYKFFGIYGLYAYNIIATITSNIQIMKIAEYTYITKSMALGTVIFSSIFIVDTLIVEKQGIKAAKTGLLINLLSYLIFVSFMYITMYYKESGNSLDVSQSIVKLFSPSLSIFLSSIISYAISQYFEIYFYTILKKITFNKFLWIRYNIATAFSMLLDQIIFSILCWRVFSLVDFSMSYIFYNYIAFNYIIRICISSLSTPLTYFIRKISPLKV